MTNSDERFRALKQGKKLLEELCDPGKTPRVPSTVRNKAHAILRHFPNDIELERIAENSPELLEKFAHNEKVLKVVRS